MKERLDVTIYVPPEDLEIVEEVERMAREDMRSFSAMVRLLLTRALELERKRN